MLLHFTTPHRGLFLTTTHPQVWILYSFAYRIRLAQICGASLVTSQPESMLFTQELVKKFDPNSKNLSSGVMKYFWLLSMQCLIFNIWIRFQIYLKIQSKKSLYIYSSGHTFVSKRNKHWISPKLLKLAAAEFLLHPKRLARHRRPSLPCLLDDFIWKPVRSAYSSKVKGV